MLNELWSFPISMKTSKDPDYYKEGSLVLSKLVPMEECHSEMSLLLQFKILKSLFQDICCHLKKLTHKSSMDVVFVSYGSDVTLYRIHVVMVPKLLKAKPNFGQHQMGYAVPEALLCFAECKLTDEAAKVLNHNVAPSFNGVLLKDKRLQFSIDSSVKFDILPDFLRRPVSQLDYFIIKELENQYEEFANPRLLIEVPDCHSV